MRIPTRILDRYNAHTVVKNSNEIDCVVYVSKHTSPIKNPLYVIRLLLLLLLMWSKSKIKKKIRLKIKKKKFHVPPRSRTVCDVY